MGKFDGLKNKWKEFRSSLAAAAAPADSVYTRVKKVIGVLIMCIYRLRSVFLAIPVAYYALKLAAYNMKHLPETVGLNLQANGEFAMTIGRELAVMGPLVITAACLVLMFASRKALYPWAVSVFTLLLPILLLFSNMYPM